MTALGAAVAAATGESTAVEPIGNASADMARHRHPVRLGYTPARPATRRPMSERDPRQPEAAGGGERWALILGASSGFGAATALALAREGYGIVGVHLDLRGTVAAAEAVRRAIEATGAPVSFHNVNAADEEKRHAVIASIRATFEERRAAGAEPFVAVFLHSLAFGTTLSYISTAAEKKEVNQKQI